MELTKEEEKLVEQIYYNMDLRGIISGEPSQKGLEMSELKILAYHLKKLFYEEISDLLLQKSLDFKDLEELDVNKRKK